MKTYKVVVTEKATGKVTVTDRTMDLEPEQVKKEEAMMSNPRIDVRLEEIKC